MKRHRPQALDYWPDPFDYKNGEQLDPVPESEPEPEPEPESNGYIDEENLFDTSKNLNATCVTPLIASLAEPFFHNLLVAGSQLQTIDGIVAKNLTRSIYYKTHLYSLLDAARGPPAHIRFQADKRIFSRHRRSTNTLYSSVELDNEIYNVGDIVLVPAGRYGNRLSLSEQHAANSTIGELFWFAKILSIAADENSAHVQWFHHGQQTILGDFAHPQEIFITRLCDDLSLRSLVAKCNCYRLPPGQRPVTLMHEDFFYSLCYDEENAVFKEIGNLDDIGTDQARSNGCPLCVADQKRFFNASFSCIEEEGKFIGLSYRGENYHPLDTIIIYSKSGPSKIGQIIKITDVTAYQNSSYRFTVRLFDRIQGILQLAPGDSVEEYGDRYLVLTGNEVEVDSDKVVGKCSVLHKGTVRNTKFWIDASPMHFIVSHYIPSGSRAINKNLRPLDIDSFNVCKECMKQTLHTVDSVLLFKRSSQKLRIFDPFAGVGGFPLAMCQVGNMELTHAIEISSSAAMTLKQNSPTTTVYNQCSNLMLQYSVMRTIDPSASLRSLDDDINLPAPPKKGDIDCIVTGFPCAPHSRMNMFQKTSDLRNELFLNAISWVDFLRPKYCVFENVEGFTKYNINAIQQTRHTVRGGIEMGGIKFLVKALITMGYQVRFGLLQAAHYGTPQSRVRFIIYAAQVGYALPKFPKPTHDFPDAKSLSITFANGYVVAPIDTARGISPLPFVTVSDAISDLKRWDWANPHKHYGPAGKEKSKRKVIQIMCRKGDPHCGLEGEIEYEHPPRSAFQARSRRRPAKDIQHITPIFNEDVIERVVNIDLEAGADYRQLNNKPKLWEWQTMSAHSANGRLGYRGGLYGRLNKDGYFNTIVTNVAPTAKQNKVLNPWCKRILSVRELARSQGFPDDFQFYAVDSKIRTLHKQIGNAVPWPLAEALGRELQKSMHAKWMEEAMDVD